MDKIDQSSAQIDSTKVPPAGYFIIADQREDVGPTVDLLRVFAAIVRRWKFLLVLAVAGASAAAAVAWSLPNKYRAQVLVAPVKSSSSDAMSGLRSQVGGLAALAGIDLGGGEHVEESFAILSSRGFAREFISENDLLPLLFAKRWDDVSRKWRADQKVPSLEDGVDMFTTAIRTVSEDKKTHLITIAVEWSSPEVAAQWANGLVDLVNERLRENAIKDADQNVQYLKQELAKTTVVEIQQAIYQLMESQVNQSMLANVQRQFAFRIVDRAVPPERKVSPRRLVLLLVGTFVAFGVGFLWLFVYFSVSFGRGPRSS